MVLKNVVILYNKEVLNSLPPLKIVFSALKLFQKLNNTFHTADVYDVLDVIFLFQLFLLTLIFLDCQNFNHSLMNKIILILVHLIIVDFALKKSRNDIWEQIEGDCSERDLLERFQALCVNKVD